MYNLFLDDWRYPIDCAKYMYRFGVDCKIYHEKWVIVRSYGDFIRQINLNGLPNIISFDYDLADVDELRESLNIEDWFNLKENIEYNGFDCAKFLISYCIKNNLNLPKCFIHSSNVEGSKKIKNILSI